MLCFMRLFRFVVGLRSRGSSGPLTALHQKTGGIPCAREHHRCGGSCGSAACLLLGSVSSRSHLYTALSWTMIKITKEFAQISAQNQGHRAWRVHAALHLELPCSCSVWLGLICWRAKDTPWERKPILDSLALRC